MCLVEATSRYRVGNVLSMRGNCYPLPGSMHRAWFYNLYRMSSLRLNPFDMNIEHVSVLEIHKTDGNNK